MGKIQRPGGIASAVLALLIVLFGATTARGQDGESMLTSYIDALNANMPPKLDTEALAMLLSEDVVQRTPFGEPMQAPMIGRDAAREFYAGFDDLFTDWTHVEAYRMISGHEAVWEGVAQGTHKESGKPLRLPIVFFLTFGDDGLLTEARTYVDVHLIAQQLEENEAP